ncbi:SDR family oxidoreductase [Streptomyces sp. NPDC097595]|uniref:SDR family oxidoreductase n=1 Tax=Streptomyces sp. NPDC097595 TaxID=3366090 RepID=UPI0037F58FC0
MSRGAGLVLGGSSGIGAAVAAKAQAAGWNVLAASRRGESSAAGVRTAVCDIRDPSAVARTTQVAAREGRLDWVVNAAGVGFYAPVEAKFAEQWQSILDTNVVGTLNLMAACTGLTEPVGHFIQIGSLASRRPSRTPGNTVYAAAKMAGAQLLERYREELRAGGIGTRVTLITPGYVGDTGFGRDFFQFSPEAAQPILEAFPPLTPQDVARVVQFALESPEQVEISEVVVRPVGQPD